MAATSTHNNLMPLYYAIVKHFTDGQPYCAQDLLDALAPLYGNYKLFTLKDIDEALATARENGLLDEVNCDIDAAGQLRIFYQMTDFGQDMVNRYIGKYSNPKVV